MASFNPRTCIKALLRMSLTTWLLFAAHGSSSEVGFDIFFDACALFVSQSDLQDILRGQLMQRELMERPGNILGFLGVQICQRCTSKLSLVFSDLVRAM